MFELPPSPPGSFEDLKRLVSSLQNPNVIYSTSGVSPWLEWMVDLIKIAHTNEQSNEQITNKKIKIITLCGSAKFENMFHAWNEILTLRGFVVISLAVYPSYKNNIKNWYDEKTKKVLDQVHLNKIDVSQAIFVITSNKLVNYGSEPYIGESTSNEIRYALETGKDVFYDYNGCRYRGCKGIQGPCPLCYE